LASNRFAEGAIPQRGGKDGDSATGLAEEIREGRPLSEVANGAEILKAAVSAPM
jgi:hypothetical protein